VGPHLATHGGAFPRWSIEMSCKSCHSSNQGEFGAEMCIHFIGLKNIDKPTVLVFARLMVCLDCGFTEFVIPTPERNQLLALYDQGRMT